MGHEYLFVFDEDSKGWWLKVDTVEQLIEFLGQTLSKRLGGGFELYWELYKEANLGATHPKSVMDFLEDMPMERRFNIMTTRSRDFNAMYGAIMQAERVGGTILDGFRSLNMEIGFNNLQDIRRYGQTYFNPAGGSTFFLNYTQFCRKKELVFPHFTERDIKIEQFKGGTHYYAYIDNIEVKNGDSLRWYSREEAYKRAVELLG